MYYPKHTDSLTLDYTIGTCLILIFLVSTTLNPLSFLYHIQRDSKLSSRLYALLALLDLIVNIYSPLFQAHNFFKETEDIGGEEKIYAKAVVQGISLVAAWSSQTVINIVIFIRLYTIKFPFGRVNRKLVWICLFYVVLHLVVIEAVKVPYSKSWIPELQLIDAPRDQIWRENPIDQVYSILVLLPITVIYILGGISSIYTVFLLTRDTRPSETREQKRKSVRIILTLSVINWSVPIAMIYANFTWPKKGSSFTNFVATYIIANGMKSIVSILDPIIILLLSRDMRVYVRDGIRISSVKIRSLLWTSS